MRVPRDQGRCLIAGKAGGAAPNKSLPPGGTVSCGAMGLRRRAGQPGRRLSSDIGTSVICHASEVLLHRPLQLGAAQPGVPLVFGLRPPRMQFIPERSRRRRPSTPRHVGPEAFGDDVPDRSVITDHEPLRADRPDFVYWEIPHQEVLDIKVVDVLERSLMGAQPAIHGTPDDRPATRPPTRHGLADIDRNRASR